MIFSIDRQIIDQPSPTPLYAAFAEVSESNSWGRINGFAACRLFKSVDVEYDAAQNGAAIADFSTLWRYSVYGPDAGAALSRIGTAPANTLAPGESARGLMLDDFGGVIDLLEVSRLGKDIFLLTTRRPQARVVQMSVRGLDANVDDITADIAAIGLIGPRTASVLSDAGFSALNPEVAASTTVRGVETAARPLQFGGLPGAELVFPADDALVIWERIVRRGDTTPIGLDALEALRIESGAPSPGIDFAPAHDGVERWSPEAIGLPHLAPLDSGWFNGRRPLRFSATAGAGGAYVLKTVAVDADAVSPGASVMVNGRNVGVVTSAAWTPRARRVVAFVRIARADAHLSGPITVGDANGQMSKARLLETVEGKLANAFVSA